MTGDPCPMCGGQSRLWCRGPDRHYGIVGEWEVYECSSCAHRFRSPVPTEAELAPYYPDSYYAFASPAVDFGPSGLHRRGVWLRMHHLKRSRGYDGLPVTANPALALAGRRIRRFPLEFGSPRFEPGGTLLDYGSGSGATVAFARYAGWQAEGIEMSAGAAAAGRQVGLDIEQGSVDVLEKRVDRYDHIMSSHCVEHVPDVKRLFAAFFAALKPGGTLAVDVPNGASEAAEHFREFYYHLTLPLHVHMFNPGSLRALATGAGFVDLRMATYSRLHWHGESQILAHPLGPGRHKGAAFHAQSKLPSLWGRVLGVPTYLRSLRPMRGDCLVLTATKPRP